MKVRTNTLSFLQVYQSQWASISQVYNHFWPLEPPCDFALFSLSLHTSSRPRIHCFLSNAIYRSLCASDPTFPGVLLFFYLWDLLYPKREYNSLYLSDVHPYALFHLTAGYNCASIFFLQCPWIRVVIAHVPFYVWMEAGHRMADKLLLVLLVIVWNGWRVTIDRRTAVSGVDAKITFYFSLIWILN